MTQDTAMRLWSDWMGWDEDGDFFREHSDDLGLSDEEQIIFGRTAAQNTYRREAAQFLRSMAAALDGGDGERCINQKDTDA